MKKVVLILLAFVPAMLFTACSNDDNNTPGGGGKSSIPNEILGTWTRYITDGNEEVIFKSDGTITFHSYSTTGKESIDEGIYEVKDNVMTTRFVRSKEKSAKGEWEDWKYEKEENSSKFEIKDEKLVLTNFDPETGTSIFTYLKGDGIRTKSISSPIVGTWEGNDEEGKMTITLGSDSRLTVMDEDKDGTQYQNEGFFSVSGNKLYLTGIREREKAKNASEWSIWTAPEVTEERSGTFKINGDFLTVTSVDDEGKDVTDVFVRK